MQSKIRILTEQAINQIKAGEVIENPASVVKELVENAIDAKASSITIEILNGGRNLIRITDNGVGMNHDDAILCLERHATSKINKAEDLETIITMGFRGEAVPSIASISKFSIITRATDEPHGTIVIVDGGKLIKTDVAAREPGTTIEVKSLFFNIPVRKKFQRSPNCDTNEIVKAVTLLGLANPHIQFDLISNEKKILSVKKESEKTLNEALKNRIISLLGDDFADSLSEINQKNENFSVYGFIGLPSVTRQNRTGQYLFINQRAVQNPLLSFAIRDGYGTALATNRHPLYVLHYTLPGGVVDVNVHPQKKEVRLRQEAALKEFTQKATIKALEKSGFFFREEKELQNFSFTAPSIPFSFTQKEPYIKECLPDEFFQKDIYKDWQPRFSEEAMAIPDFFFEKLKEEPSQEKSIRPLATIPNYLIVDPTSLSASFNEKKRDAALILIDQKKAHARIIFERFDRTSSINIQPLIIPEILEVTPFEETCLLEELIVLKKMGLEIDQSGPRLFTISAIPDFLQIQNLQQFIKDFISETIINEKSGIFQKEKEKQLATLAVRHAISAHKTLSIEEAKNLIKELMECQMPFQDPKGNETFAFITKDELKTFFK